LPRPANRSFQLVATLVELGQLDEACEAFRTALKIDPSDSRTYYNLADTLDEMGFAAEAGEHWRAYFRFDSTSQWARQARSRIAAG